MKSYFLSFGALLCLFSYSTNKAVSGSQQEQLATTEKPNIIFIMTDDHARKAMNAYSYDLIETTNLDRIANEGIKLNNAFVTNSLCGPSRAVFLTGRYTHIN